MKNINCMINEFNYVHSYTTWKEYRNESQKIEDWNNYTDKYNCGYWRINYMEDLTEMAKTDPDRVLDAVCGYYSEDEEPGERFNYRRAFWTIMDGYDYYKSFDNINEVIEIDEITIDPDDYNGAEIESADAAREIAKAWQTWQSEEHMTAGEMQAWADLFNDMAQKFPELADEFRENTII